jgi:L-lactate dehydrogenase (cytochrome)
VSAEAPHPAPAPTALFSRTDSVASLPRALRSLLSLDDFERAAKKHLPRPIFGYVSGAAEDNRAQAMNRSAFDEYAFVPRVLKDVAQRSHKVQLLGHTWSLPFGVAPMGLLALSAYRGDIALARAACEANIPMVLSGTGLIRLEDVIAAAPGAWFQMYPPGTEAGMDALMDRIAAAGYRTLVVTVDVAVMGNRENNVRSGFSTPLRPSLRLALDGLARPRWLAGTFLRTLLRHGMPHFENSFAERGAPVLSGTVMRDFSGRAHLSWRHLERIRNRWPGDLVLKGVLAAEDARIAREHGCDALIVSNHGGRQLDHAVAPLAVLPGIVAAVPGLPVTIDGGIRRGTDVLKALALGASFVFLGRPFNYAAALGGEAGVAHAIGILREEIDRDMALLGITSFAELRPEMLWRSGDGNRG